MTMLGKTHTNETKRKISQSMKELPPEFGRNISLSKLGKPRSKETRLKIGLGHIGKKHSLQTIEKIKKARQKQKLPYRDSKPERLVENILKSKEIIYKKHVQTIVGYPDFVIDPNICVFIDGEHWHANPKKYKSNDLITGKRKAKDIWIKDEKINKKLNKMGYKVIRIWEHQILNNPRIVLKEINNLNTTYDEL